MTGCVLGIIPIDPDCEEMGVSVFPPVEPNIPGDDTGAGEIVPVLGAPMPPVPNAEVPAGEIGADTFPVGEIGFV